MIFPQLLLSSVVWARCKRAKTAEARQRLAALGGYLDAWEAACYYDKHNKIMLRNEQLKLMEQIKKTGIRTDLGGSAW